VKTLLDLDDNDCRYVFGDGPFLFCGDPKQDKSSYCPHHHAICWTSARQPVAKARVYHGTNFAA
jgi:hypothetical protein